MAANKQYSDKQVKTLIEMWEAGNTTAEIGKAIGKKKHSVAQYIHRNRSKYNLEKRDPIRYGYEKKHSSTGFVNSPTFDEHWKGPVPLGHWMITKPWKKAS